MRSGCVRSACATTPRAAASRDRPSPPPVTWSAGWGHGLSACGGAAGSGGARGSASRPIGRSVVESPLPVRITISRTSRRRRVGRWCGCKPDTGCRGAEACRRTHLGGRHRPGHRRDDGPRHPQRGPPAAPARRRKGVRVKAAVSGAVRRAHLMVCGDQATGGGDFLSSAEKSLTRIMHGPANCQRHGLENVPTSLPSANLRGCAQLPRRWGREGIMKAARMLGVGSPILVLAGVVPTVLAAVPGGLEGRRKLRWRAGMLGASLTATRCRQAPSDRLALKPYWGKPNVRNFRGTMETSASCEARSAPTSYSTCAGHRARGGRRRTPNRPRTQCGGGESRNTETPSKPQ